MPKITRDDLAAFARLSGDYNPVHIDKTYASFFGTNIVYGIYQVFYILEQILQQLPGDSTQNLDSIKMHNLTPARYSLTSLNAEFPNALFVNAPFSLHKLDEQLTGGGA
ncbi:hypothetical protein LS71_005360 [Helicobacter jaachi]|uniref:MaoC-like domain-containing protein n=1 Tax=Helicobacter jaachi TaxID=1677920 RepID=A0A4U8TCY3_9HELI|nr:MaoC/PaaZ C-terminal domain-containing protein [Helicobacter jaachi]TLD96497.1 hypothetical protein LS71_005360 [Helicobacter jaachi]